MPPEQLRANNIRPEDIERDPNLQYPGLLVDAVLAISALKGKPLDPDKFVFSMADDALGRPEIKLGYKLSPERVLPSPLFAVYEEGVVRAYTGEGNTEQLLNGLRFFVEHIHGQSALVGE